MPFQTQLWFLLRTSFQRQIHLRLIEEKTNPRQDLDH